MKYLLTVVDDYWGVAWTILFLHKSQIYGILKKFFAYVKNHFGFYHKNVRSDNNFEFLSSECQTIFAEIGVIHKKSMVYTLQ